MAWPSLLLSLTPALGSNPGRLVTLKKTRFYHFPQKGTLLLLLPTFLNSKEQSNLVLKHDQRRSTVLYYGRTVTALQRMNLLECIACLEQGGKKGIENVTFSCSVLPG